MTYKDGVYNGEVYNGEDNGAWTSENGGESYWYLMDYMGWVG